MTRVRSPRGRRRLPALIVGIGLTLAAIAGPISALTGPAAASGDPVIAAAGDIACDPASSNFNNGQGVANACRQRATSDLLVNSGYTAVLALGDNQYYCGSHAAFNGSYDPSWGRVKSMTYPSVGNHEYLTNGGSGGSTGCDASNANAAGYYQYFGAAAGDPARGYYSFDIGAWHLIALNTQCSAVGGCSANSPQGQWLAADLDAHPNQCTLAFFHIPRFSSGGRAASNSSGFWQLLYDHHADVILNGHDHIYERFAPQNPSGVLDVANGIREFIVGTGGANSTSLATTAANSEVRNASTFGVLALRLHATGYDWQFVPEAGKTFTDTGSGTCHATGGGGGGGGQTLLPVADAYVDASKPTRNYGSSTTLRVDASPVQRSYLSFSLAGVSGTITRATLRVYATTASSAGYGVGGVSGSWTESTITSANAPSVGPTVGSSGSFAGGSWTSVDVTSLLSSGTLSLALSGINSTGVKLASRESGANAPQLVLELAGGGGGGGGGGGSDTSPPSVPAIAWATAVSSSRVNLAWSAATDNVGVAGYGIYRNGTPIGTTSGATATSFSDLSVSPSTTYSYTVDAFDAAGNRSAPSAPAVVTTPASSPAATLLPTADAYVDSSNPTKNYGGSTTLRVDGSPVVHSYLAFNLAGVSGTVTRATLRVYANSASGAGYTVGGVSGSWTELGITAANAPPVGPGAGSSGSFGAGSWTSVDVTSLLSGGTLSLALSGINSTAVSMASREAGPNAPQLVLELAP